MTELKPCPFCGREPVSYCRTATEGERNKQHKFVVFIACYCDGYSATAHQIGRGETPDDAEQAAALKWNRRVGDDPQLD